MRAGDWRWPALWFALLLPLAILFPPIPIDETRYLTAAWEMFNSGQWLVPTINGAWYSDKSPLLRMRTLPIPPPGSARAPTSPAGEDRTPDGAGGRSTT